MSGFRSQAFGPSSAPQELVVYRETAIHYHGDSCLFQLASNLGVADAHLHPNQLRPDLEQLLQQDRDVLGAPEDVDDVDGTGCGGGGAEVGMYRFAQGHASSGVDRYDGVAGLLEVRGHAVTGAFRLSAESDHRDSACVSDQFCQMGPIGRHPQRAPWRWG